MKSKIWLNCSRRNPVYGMFFVGLSFLWDHHQNFNHLCLYAMIASADKTFKSNTIASNKRSYYNFIAFTKCWSNMSDTLTQTSPTCWSSISKMLDQHSGFVFPNLVKFRFFLFLCDYTFLKSENLLKIMGLRN